MKALLGFFAGLLICASMAALAQVYNIFPPPGLSYQNLSPGGRIQSTNNSIGVQFTTGGDLIATGGSDPVYTFRGTAGGSGDFTWIQSINDVSIGPQLGVGPSTAAAGSCAGSGGYALQPATGPCEYLETSAAYPLVVGVNFTTAAILNTTRDFLAVGPNSVIYLNATATGSAATTTLGDAGSIGSVTNIVGGTPLNTQANGVPIATNLSGASGSVGGSALIAGACSSTSFTVTGAAVGNAVAASPITYPGDGNYWVAVVTSTNTVTVKVCAVIADTPTASAYTVRVFK